MAIVDGLGCTSDTDNALALVNVWVCYDFDEKFLAHGYPSQTRY
jgi:hypothetical protein